MSETRSLIWGLPQFQTEDTSKKPKITPITQVEKKPNTQLTTRRYKVSNLSVQLDAVTFVDVDYEIEPAQIKQREVVNNKYKPEPIPELKPDKVLRIKPYKSQGLKELTMPNSQPRSIYFLGYTNHPTRKNVLSTSEGPINFHINKSGDVILNGYH